VKALLAQGEGVRAGDIFPEKIRESISRRESEPFSVAPVVGPTFGPGVEACAFQFGRPETYAPAFEGIRRMFLLRPPQISNVARDMFPALQASKAAGVQRIVFLSLIGIEQNTAAPHYQVEQWLKASGMEYTFLRASFFMQNMNTTHRDEIRERDEIFVPVGRARTSFIDVRDIGAVAALTLTQPGHAGQAYDLTGGEALDYYQTADLFSAVLGRKIVYKNPSAAAYFLRRLRLGGGLMYALVTTWLYTNTRGGMAAAVTGEVERLLGRPPIAMRRYIEDYQEAWKR